MKKNQSAVQQRTRAVAIVERSSRARSLRGRCTVGSFKRETPSTACTDKARALGAFPDRGVPKATPRASAPLETDQAFHKPRRDRPRRADRRQTGHQRRPPPGALSEAGGAGCQSGLLVLKSVIGVRPPASAPAPAPGPEPRTARRQSPAPVG